MMRKKRSKRGAATVIVADDYAKFFVHNRLHWLGTLRRETCARCAEIAGINPAVRAKPDDHARTRPTRKRMTW
jgi:fructosamine-3-kinase